MELLTFEQGIKQRSQQSADLDQTFGNIEASKGIKRLLFSISKSMDCTKY